jgi:hypothetical protein
MEVHRSHLERSRMSDVHHIGRRPILAGIGAAALVTSFEGRRGPDHRTKWVRNTLGRSMPPCA